MVDYESNSRKEVIEKLHELTRLITDYKIISFAFVIVREDNSDLISGYTEGNRLLTLAAVTDLQHDLCKKGYKNG